MSVALSVFYIGMECVRTFCLRHAWHLRRLHHNGLYRAILVLFSLCLLIDSLWFWIDKHNADSNIFLILALLLGDWFLTFFLRAWRKFSFFTILFQKVLVGDMFRFSIMILLELIAFSAAMYVAYLPAGSYELPEEFEDVWSSILTMFRLMLGLSDVEVLSKAPAAWLAVGLYVAFVLLTYVLLLNSLIAMMSQTCALVSQDRDLQWHMQRLSVLLMLESLLPPRCRPLLGQRKSCRRYSLKTGLAHQEGRYLKPVTSVQASYTDGKAILRRQNLVRTMGFGELTLKLAPSQFNTYNSPVGYNTKTTMQRIERSSPPQQYITLNSKTHNSYYEEQENIYIDEAGLNNNGFDSEKANELRNVSMKTLDNNKSQRKRAEFPQQSSYSPKQGRRRHNSERKNRRTQTDTNEPLSRSYPDSKLRGNIPAAPGSPNLRQEEPGKPVVHYLAVPGMPLLSETNLHNVPFGLVHQPVGNSSSREQVAYTNLAQPLSNGQFQSNAYTSATRAPTFLSVAEPHQLIQQANSTSQAPQPHLVPTFYDRIPEQAKRANFAARVQFIDVNDLNKEV
ncbi:transient receptor potential cation channel subfamily v member 4-like [Plakobranchus ocellatus]|uniref:Transient receptor potential cation channel subfamily v member 4-like n=1 Tax=Plakobranchus ocellatus TaxID=259542 RepID=A0AAV3ZXJ0_9GAST|nr:transient receptor potential cation channel subfamily v member 4-like [Plakobranchus ocellatus]